LPAPPPPDPPRPAPPQLDVETTDAAYRHVLGHFCTGVTVVTGVDDGRPAGFACQAFAALSLTPPLVLFCPGTSSRTWPAIANSGYFCVNVLAAGQQEIARRFGVSGPDKFAGLTWSTSPSGAPVLAGALTWVECVVEAVHEAGDHYLVVGRVTLLGPCQPGAPLLFYRGRYAAMDAGSDTGPPEVVDTLLAWSRHGDWL
jgi:3-hydroxy-9,10-secoandrosta-1,3,5(10)-triene-9,17-dione monooxygenase reductase component